MNPVNLNKDVSLKFLGYETNFVQEVKKKGGGVRLTLCFWFRRPTEYVEYENKANTFFFFHFLQLKDGAQPVREVWSQALRMTWQPCHDFSLVFSCFRKWGRVNKFRKLRAAIYTTAQTAVRDESHSSLHWKRSLIPPEGDICDDPCGLIRFLFEASLPWRNQSQMHQVIQVFFWLFSAFAGGEMMFLINLRVI